jgi:hypothetical protein
MPVVEEEVRERRIPSPEDRRGPEERHPEGMHEEQVEKAAVGAASIEGLLGIATIVLAILGLANILRGFLTPVAVIVFGVALLMQGSALATRLSHLIFSAERGRFDASHIGGGVTVQLLSGLAGIVLGILALIGIYPVTLMSAAILTFGGSLLLGSGAAARLNSLAFTEVTENSMARAVAFEGFSAAAGLQMLIGVGVIVLGVLALVHIHVWTLNLVALLGLGFSGVLAGTAVTSRMLGFLHRY